MAEEAAKLLAALSDRAREHGAARAGDAGGPDASADPGEPGRPLHGENCRWCPLCQVIGYVRSTDPEVRDQLTASAGAFVLALRELLDQAGRAPASDSAKPESASGREHGVEHIDVSDEREDQSWA